MKIIALDGAAAPSVSEPASNVVAFKRKSPVARPLADRFWEKVERRGADECWPWTDAPRSHGYGDIRASLDGRAVSLTSNRAAYLVAHGHLPGDQNVLHSCNNRICCNPAHLRLGGQRQNMWDASRAGSRVRRLTDEQVLSVVSMLDAGMSMPKIGALHGVSKHTVRHIRIGVVYSWLTGIPPAPVAQRKTERKNSRVPDLVLRAA